MSGERLWGKRRGYIHTFTNTRAERDARVTAGRKEAAEEEEQEEEEGGLGACVDRRKNLRGGVNKDR